MTTLPGTAETTPFRLLTSLRAAACSPALGGSVEAW